MGAETAEAASAAVGLQRGRGARVSDITSPSLLPSSRHYRRFPVKQITKKGEERELEGDTANKPEMSSIIILTSRSSIQLRSGTWA